MQSFSKYFVTFFLFVSLPFCSHVFAASIEKAVPVLGNISAPKGGTFVYWRGEEPISLNPIVSDGHAASDIQFHVVEPLLAIDVETNRWIPALADRWTISKDQKTYEFHLRQNARFSDGHPVTSNDVKFSFDVLFNPEFPTAHMRPYYEGIRNVEIVDAHTVRFHAKSSYFLNFLTSAGLPIVPAHIYSDSHVGPRLHKTVVGTGPYMVEGWEPGSRILLRRNPDWWGRHESHYAGAYNPDRVIFKFVGNENTALEMLKRGEIDYMPLSAEAYYKRAVGRAWGRDVHKVKFTNAYPKASEQIWWNMERPILSDVRVRRALSHLMDRNFVVQKFDFATTVASTGPWYPQSDFADPMVAFPEFNPTLALRQLKAAGWSKQPDGRLAKSIDGKLLPLSLTILVSGKASERYLTVFQRDARRAGVEINLRFVDGSLLYPILSRRDFDAIQTGGGGGLVDFDPKPTWHSDAAGRDGANLSGYKNALVDHLIERARLTPSIGARRPLMRQIFRTITDDAPALFVYNENESFYAYSARVGRPADTYRYDVGTKYWWINAPEEKLAQVRR